MIYLKMTEESATECLSLLYQIQRRYGRRISKEKNHEVSSIIKKLRATKSKKYKERDIKVI